MHVALWALSIVSLIGAGVCLLRPAHAEAAGDEEEPFAEVVAEDEALAAESLAV